MANTRIEDDKLHGARIGCRITSDERARLKQEADSHGCTLSQLVRSRVVGTHLTSRIDSKAIAELRRQGGLLKHLAMETKNVDAVQVRETLSAIKSAIKAISDSGEQK